MSEQFIRRCASHRVPLVEDVHEDTLDCPSGHEADSWEVWDTAAEKVVGFGGALKDPLLEMEEIQHVRHRVQHARGHAA